MGVHRVGFASLFARVGLFKLKLVGPALVLFGAYGGISNVRCRGIWWSIMASCAALVSTDLTAGRVILTGADLSDGAKRLCFPLLQLPEGNL
jgi:hypothetical protein